MADDLKLQNHNGFQGGKSNDRISNLPDSLIQHILSFLPTKYVVPTTILSKRCKSLWIGVPSLDFDERGTMYSYTRFMNFVEKVLLLRDGSIIKQFRLSFPSCFAFSHSPVESLIATVLSHKVQHIDINLFVNDHYSLPCSLFDCQSLSILKLSMKCTLELPSRISLPCLKVLHLSCFAIPNAKSIENLFSCCPVLEELTLERCKWIHRNSITISIPSLKSLTIGNSLEEDDPVDDHDSCYIKVEAPALESFNYTSTLISEFDLSKLSSIKIFQLSLSYSRSFSYSRVQSLVAAVVSHEVQHLDITLSVNYQFSLPCSIFDCQSLSILKLSMKCTLELPIHIYLPCLKVLHLRDLAFPNAKSIEKFFSSCPILEELNLARCRLIRWDGITISTPSLKSLIMFDSFEKYDLVVDHNSGYIKVEAPALQFLYYTGRLTHHLKMTSSSSIKACIHMIWHYYYVGIRAPRLVNLLQGLENMISLTISNETAELLLLDSDHFPVFHHLKYLDLSLKLTGRVFLGLLKFFSFTPNLSTLRFSQGVDNTICQAGINWMPKPLPNCFLVSLKYSELGNVVGDSHELLFLTSYLEKAASLEKINIIQSKYITLDKQQLLRDEAEKLSTRFKNCAINVQ